MPGRLGIDFGTSNTVVAAWDETRKEGVPLHVPDYGRRVGDAAVSVVPSVIHYADGGRRWLGQQVFDHNVYDSPRTFRWMKRYVARRSPAKVRVDGRAVSHFDAGRDFLSTVLAFAAAELKARDLRDEEVALTVPVEAFEHYEDWLGGVAEAARLPRFRLIDEPSAAALGYGAHVQPGDVYLIFDFGGGTLDVSVVLIEEAPASPAAGGVSGRRCRVLGKAGAEVGGASIDQWLFEDVLRQNRRHDADDDVRRVSRSLLVECEAAKERLSSRESADVTVTDPDTGAVLAASYTRGRFEALLEERGAFEQIDAAVRRAVNAARERGYAEEHVKAVLMVGGSSVIPAVQTAVRRIFGRQRVMLGRALDAVARGAAAFVAGVDIFDHIQHDYAVRHIDPKKGEYDYWTIVKRGTPYPTKEPVARVVVKASHDGQRQLGLAVFEVGRRRARGAGGGGAEQPMELVFDPSGAARVTRLSADEEEDRTLFWLNEHTPTFLAADPPGKQGEPRFEVQFGIDANKRLLVTARDLASGRVTYRDYPVVKLT